MLTIQDQGYYRNCEGTTRRELLRIGSLSLGGLSLPWLLSAQGRAAEAGSHLRDKSVVLLFLSGGATHIETFDPKMSAPAEFRSVRGEVETSLPGVTFGGDFPLLARLADKMAIVRSFRHGANGHEDGVATVITAGNPTKAMLGSVYSHVAGTTNARTGMPNNTIVTPGAVGYRGLKNPNERLDRVGSLGPTFAPFHAGGDGQIKQNMVLKIPRERFEDRQALLAQVDRLKEEVVGGNIDHLCQQAYDVILGGIASAFDVSQEHPSVLARYDTSMIKIPADVLKKRDKIAPIEPVALGKQMLLARRLCEAGCGFVTVSSAGWNMHSNGASFGMDDGLPVLGAAVDKAVSAFIEDVEQRGLSDKILLVITGDFGRTPRINDKGGRDHWGNLCTLAFAGGGLKMGQVIGGSDSKASAPASDPVTPTHLMATILHTLFDPGQLRLQPKAAAVSAMLSNAEPIRELF